MSHPEALKQLQDRLGYQFRNSTALTLALTHRSHGADNNERLEFLGDSILNFIIGEALYQQFPQGREGQLSRLRSHLVRGDTLAELGREFALGDHLRLGEGELKSGGKRRDSILADTVEALIGAIYLESGLEPCRERVLDWYAGRLAQLSLNTSAKDAKTRLQEALQARHEPLPVYRVVETQGEAHAFEFTVECKISLLTAPTRGQASNRREAEKQAAAEALRQLNL